MDMDLCQPRKCGLECIKYCPVNKSGADCIVLDEDTRKAHIDEDICNGCGICVKVCPFDAISIVNLASEMASDKVHQYGPNSFRVYRLPTPRKGEVIGLLGRNGMGKSTIVNILAGVTKPNLGRYEEPADWEDILRYYSGTELRAHFESIRDKRIKASIKPQQVHTISKAFDGTVKDILDRYDDRGVSRQLVLELDIGTVMDRSVQELSGGELQRLAVAVAASRDADFYFFDEPSSYNDIFQRTGVARVIQNLADLGKSVMVVEHDLTMLDLLSDHIDVLYGEPGAYGIVSRIMSSKVGINAFLDGYLPGENVRFRDRTFTLDASAASADFGSSDIIVSYPRLRKRYRSFAVDVEPGSIYRGEILGVVGANALGKTTMMKMIAGVEEPDSGSVHSSIKIAYKPQYLNGDSDAEVSSILGAANGSPIEGSQEEEQVVEPLRIPRLYTKSLKSLSGGELQKVAVASCLLQKADLYTLDEPSAFLDVEDRIAVAKFLQRFTRSFGRAAMVIDHDIQLMDIVSDRMVIFDGESGRRGHALPPADRDSAMNQFLHTLDITFRRDEKSMRPRINKPGSRLDKRQKESGRFYSR